MFGPFRRTSPLSGGLLWHVTFHHLPTSQLTGPQENPLAPLHPPKNPPAQTPTHGRQRDRDRRLRARQDGASQ